MTVRLSMPFRPAADRVRASLPSRGAARDFFELLCAAGELGFRLPDGDINLSMLSRGRDPRRRLAREFAARGRAARRRPREWAQVGRLIERLLVRRLRQRGDAEYQPLRVLVSSAAASLGADGSVPEDPLLREAWKTVVGVFAKLFATRVRALGTLPLLDAARIRALHREAAAGLRIGHVASGRRPGPIGRMMAVDPALTALVGDALGRRLAPGYLAKFLYYNKAGDQVWPHPDDPKYAVNCIMCIDRQLAPERESGSAFLAYRPDGSVERFELPVGAALAMESGVVHSREPLRDGERVVLLSILYAPAD